MFLLRRRIRPAKKQASAQRPLNNRDREIFVPQTILPSKFLAALKRWLAAADFGADLTIKIAVGRDEHGFSGVLMCAEAEGIHGTLFTILSGDHATQLADRLGRQLRRATDDSKKFDVYSGIAFALREATKSLMHH
jgi:hypothetical protein